MNTRPYDNPHATFFNGALNYGFLIWALTVRALREASGGAIIGVLKGILMAFTFCIAFYLLMSFMGLAGLTVRGDMMVFILIGVGFFFTAKMTMMAAMKAMTGSWALTRHPHLTPVLFVYAESLATLYNWTLAIMTIYIANGLVKGSFDLQEPIMFFPIYFITWLTGVGAGMVMGFGMFYFSWFAMIKRILFKLIFFSAGKFTNANLIPTDMLWFFYWNPLFHLIDQMRDAAFVNYTARKTNLEYPIFVCLGLLLLGHILHDYMLRHRNEMTGP